MQNGEIIQGGEIGLAGFPQGSGNAINDPAANGWEFGPRPMSRIPVVSLLLPFFGGDPPELA